MNGAAIAMVVTLQLLQLGFERVDEQNGVVVYRRDGHHIELGAEADLPAPPERVQALLLDYSHHAEWVKGISKSALLKRAGNAIVVYQRLGLPVVADRDFTLRVTWGREGDTLWTRFTTRNELGPPPVSGVVRVPSHQGEWLLRPIDGGKRTRATYRFKLDLGGSLPGWMGKNQAVKDLVGFFEAMRAKLK